MTDESSRATVLRAAFDGAFALRPATAAAEVEDLLAIRVAGDPYAIRVRDVVEVVTKRKVVPVPAATPALLGIVGVRGELVPVFGLASLLGYAAAAESARWLVLCGLEDPIAFAFSELEGHERIERSAIHLDDGSHSARSYIREVARTDLAVRPVIGIPLLVKTLRSRSTVPRSFKET